MIQTHTLCIYIYENEKKMFQDLINLIEKLDGLSISEKIGPIGQVEAVIVEHI